MPSPKSNGTTIPISPITLSNTHSNEKEKLDPRSVDAALQFLRQTDHQPLESIEISEKQLLRKIDILIMPLLFGAYLFQYMDKSLINYASVMGLIEDTKMNAAQFSYLATFFYVTYAVFQPVHAFLVQKSLVGKYLGVMVSLWGITVATHSACKSFNSLITVRLLLGIFEAAVAPSLLIVTGMWYKRAEQPLRIGIWYLGVGSGVVIGALSSYGFQFYTSTAFHSWQIMYLTFGLITFFLGILIALFLPDSPMKSHLTSSEKFFAIERLRENQTGIENRVFKMNQFKETVLDIRTWMIVVIILTGNIPAGATGSFSSLLIKGFGYDSKQSALLQVPSGFIQMLAVILAAYSAGHSNNRGFAIIALLLPGILGGALMAFLPSGLKYKAGKLVGIYLTGIFGPNLAIMYSWAAANYAGHTKKVTINALILVAYSASNIIGPLTFTQQTSPEYVPAKVAVMVSLALAVVMTGALRWVYVLDNKKRDVAALASGAAHVEDIEFMDLTDKQNPEFRYAL